MFAEFVQIVEELMPTLTRSVNEKRGSCCAMTDLGYICLCLLGLVCIGSGLKGAAAIERVRPRRQVVQFAAGSSIDPEGPD